MKTVTLSIALTLAANGAFAATHGLATDNLGNQIAVGFNDKLFDHAAFGSIQPSTKIVNDETKALGAMAHFFGKLPKQVLVRKYNEYSALKTAAIKAGVTSPERIAQTDIVVVPEFAAMFGIDNIDEYGVDRKLVTVEERATGGLDYNNKLLNAVFADITARVKADELKPVDGVSTMELS